MKTPNPKPQTPWRAVAETLAPRAGHELPKYIWKDVWGYRVEIKRGKLRFRGSAKTVEEALRLREQFLAAAGPQTVPTKHVVLCPRPSNTGVRGISEMTKWTRYRPRNCFQVNLRDCAGAGSTGKRFFYGPRVRVREEALRMAVEFRAAMEVRRG